MVVPFQGVMTWVRDQVSPPNIKPVNYCERPSPYITEIHCPPKRAPAVPRRE